jgi:hypothetical protein
MVPESLLALKIFTRRPPPSWEGCPLSGAACVRKERRKGVEMPARLIQVIETDLTIRGNGKDDPYRTVTQYWSTDGELLAEVDPCKPEPHFLDFEPCSAVFRPESMK